MRIIQTVNDTIRLLFNPKTETFSLSDFLLVRDVEENFLAQVIEVYDDKFDQEANVAKIRLVYRIVNGNEIVPYDNYTPSRECEVAKIKQSEIEKCINLNKKTIPLGKNYRSKEKMEINTDFFENNCVIFADKYEQSNQIAQNLAPKLSGHKNVLILDFSGTCYLENVNNYIAGENFKIPLSSKTIDYIQQKTLMRAKFETQVVLDEIYEEVKNFLIENNEDYIPYQRFLKVIHNQCKQTPSVELLVLINWLKKYNRENIFAKNKREFENLFKSLQKNKITVLDLSNIKTEWQKDYLEYIIENIQNEVFVLVRLNDNNVNNEILNKIYLKKPNISFIPSFAYGYKKASYIMEFAQNYILMPTLNPKRDFSHATFQIQSLNQESYMLFGEDTRNFIFTLENEAILKKRKDKDDDSDKMFISLNLQLEDMTALELRPNNFELKQSQPRRKRLQEEIKLSDVLGNDKKEDFEEEEKEELTIPYNVQEGTIEDIEEKETIVEAAVEEIIEEAPEEIVEENEANFLDILGEDELDYFEQEEIKVEEKKEIEEVIEAEVIEEIEENKIEEIEEKEIEIPKLKEVEDDGIKAISQPSIEATSELEKFAQTQEEDEEETKEEVIVEEIFDESILDEIDEINQQQEKEEIEETKEIVSTIIEEAKEEVIEEKIKELNRKEDEDLDKKFDEIMNEAKDSSSKNDTLKINDKVVIDLESIKKEVKNKEPKLPIFTDEEENVSEVPNNAFVEGGKVKHESYGVGNILKVINYGTRCLLQIEFEEVGKRLLDPKIAKLTPVE